MIAIDIPLNKALAPVEVKNFDDWVRCKGCALRDLGIFCTEVIACQWANRKDGKDVVLKLVDLPRGE